MTVDRNLSWDLFLVVKEQKTGKNPTLYCIYSKRHGQRSKVRLWGIKT